MFKIILMLTLWLQAFAEPITPTPKQKELDELFLKNKDILVNCLDRVASKDVNHGCNDSLVYMSQLCQKRSDYDFRKVYLARQKSYVSQACEFTYKSEVKTDDFFDLDQKSCIHGYESLVGRLFSVRRQKDFFDEAVMGRFEKRLCKEFKRFINLCVYIDGNLKNVLPNEFNRLPSVNLAGNSVCPSQSKNLDMPEKIGLYITEISKRGLPREKIYEELILNLRKDQNSKPKGSEGDCSLLRTQYAGLSCESFEQVSDDDPLSDEELEKKNKRSKLLKN